MTTNLAELARRSSPRGSIPSRFKPSPWMWQDPSDPRLHPCFARWLRENGGRAIADWTLYECWC